MFIGLDLGTSGLKAVLMDDGGNVLASAAASYPNPHPHPGWSEQHPQDWIDACTKVMDRLKAADPSAIGSVRAIGLSGQMHGATLIDEAGKVLRPAVLWNDTRAYDEAKVLDHDPQMREITGNIVFPGFTAPKLLWLEKNEPELFARIHKVLLPKDYLRFWLTGEYATEMSDASGTAWLDVGGRRWSETALTLSHMHLDQMPALYEGTEVTGQLRPSLGAQWGITGAVDVVGGGGDNAVAACATGCLSEGQGFVSLGTSGVLLAAKNTCAPAPQTAVHTFCHAVPDRWYQMGVILAATDSLNWLSRTLDQDAATLANSLPDTIDGPADLLFLPYLSGERTPHNNAHVRGAFIGLDISHGPKDMTQAVMEGVSFALADCLDALRSTGTSLRSLLALGGGTRSAFWCETIATALNLPLDLPASGEYGAASGAARLAMASQTGQSVEAIMSPPPIGRTIDPRPELADRYAAQWARYRRLYQAVTV
ncbi:xylulokinase [Marivita sp. S2033]|uniref:xylulokinase n=1 Tax=Marivita sp. S2033 TaxID=3373187 RepID=UPI0039827B96